jgi:AraC family transcriptional regulator
MNGIENILAAIEIYEHSLSQQRPIRSVSILSQKTGYSPYHFSRLFSSIVGISPKDYLQGRLLTHMLDELTTTSLTLATLAKSYGFTDYASFSKAFKNRFGCSPNEYRNHPYTPQGRLEIFHPETRKEEVSLAGEVQIVTIKPFVLSGIAYFIGNEVESFHSQWNTFLRAQKQIAGSLEPKVFCQYTAWLEEKDLFGLSVLCALEVEKDSLQLPVFTTRRVEGGEYLRFVHEGDLSLLGLTYKYIYGTWFATQEIQPRGSWEFQRYPQTGNTVEIFIPVRTKTHLPS